jgi:hypothetical protein
MKLLAGGFTLDNSIMIGENGEIGTTDTYFLIRIRYWPMWGSAPTFGNRNQKVSATLKNQPIFIPSTQLRRRFYTRGRNIL